MTRLSDLAPECVRSIAPYQPGKPITTLAREFGLDAAQIIKLASNENPLGTSPKASQAVQEALRELARYPDGSGFALRTAISDKFGLAPERLIFGNGSNDILDLAARTFLSAESEAVYSQYAFAVYALATQALGARGVVVAARDFGHDLEAMLRAITARTRIVFIANPNNPTGTILQKDALLAFLRQVPKQTLVVLDEAYDEYLPPALKSAAFSWLDEFENLLVSRTFSKAYGLAGLRVGYGVGAPEVVAMMNRVRQPFNVNSVAQAAAVTALTDDGFVARTHALNLAGMQQLVTGFERLGLSYIPSFGNFVSFRIGNATGIYRRLLQHGIIVRPIANYGLPEYLRVSIGLYEENARFLQVLENILSEEKLGNQS